MLSGESCQYTAQEDLEYSELRETSTYLNSVAGTGSVVACASLTRAATSAVAVARQRRVYGRAPSGRGYHGTILYDSRVIVIGGFDGSEVFGDVMILELAVHAYYSQISHFTIEV